MLTDYSVACPAPGCGWLGCLFGSARTDANGGHVPPTSLLVFECPRCAHQWEAQIVGDDLVPLSSEQPVPIFDRLRQVLMQPTNGVVGLVDDLLTLCGQHGLQLDWQADRCRVRSPGGAWHDLLHVPFRKSVFRAILARIAALCNEQVPSSVSPYDGQGELLAGADPPVTILVAFANTTAEQRLELTTQVPSATEAPRGAVTSRTQPAS